MRAVRPLPLLAPLGAALAGGLAAALSWRVTPLAGALATLTSVLGLYVLAASSRSRLLVEGSRGALIGLKLTNDRTAQAWARKHQQLRSALIHLVDERIPPEPTP